VPEHWLNRAQLLSNSSFDWVAAFAGGYRESGRRSDFCIRVKIDLVGRAWGYSSDNREFSQTGRASLRSATKKLERPVLTALLWATLLSSFCPESRACLNLRRIGRLAKQKYLIFPADFTAGPRKVAACQLL